MIKGISKSIFSSFLTILPIMIIVYLFCACFNIENRLIISFTFSAFLIVIGMSLFTYGADLSMMPMGKKIGNSLVKTRKLSFILIACLIVGIIITIAEPDLRVLALKITSIPTLLLTLVVAIGIGIFLLLSSLRTLYKIDYKLLLFIFYGIIIVLLTFVPKEYIAIAFDAGGVTMGPISAPFVIALGVGLSSMRNDKEAKNDSFGFVGLCAIGPTLLILLLGLFYKIEDISYIENISNERFLLQYSKEFVNMIKDITLSLIPIIIIFVIYQLLKKEMSKKEIRKVTVGLSFVLFGLAIFLTGANIGFMNAGYTFGNVLAGSNFVYLLIPLSMLIGYFIVLAEPTTKLLIEQIVDLTSGSISKKALGISLSFGVALATGLGIARIIFSINIIYILIPGYVLALLLTIFTPKIFGTVAFDTGGVVAGPLTTTFLLSISIGTCLALDKTYLVYGFGLVSFVALMPRIMILLLGIIYKTKTRDYLDIKNIDESIVEYKWEV